MPPVNGNFGEPVNIVGNTGSGFYYMYIWAQNPILRLG
jgi:hypothetical protein